MRVAWTELVVVVVVVILKATLKEKELVSCVGRLLIAGVTNVEICIAARDGWAIQVALRIYT
jgi:hypothetical protein